MKKILLSIAIIFSGLQIMAQDDVACVPDSTFADSLQAVFPMPFDPATQMGGIAAFPACIGEPYELVFSFKLGDSIGLNGLNLDAIRAEIATTGAVAGMPEGVNYFCNPPDCIFQDTALGCIVLRGTVTENNTPGVSSLVITANLTLDGLGTFEETIPGRAITGEYNLVVSEAGNCSTTSTNDLLANNLTLVNTPNPVIDHTLIELSSDISGDFQFQVFDLAGKLMHRRTVNLTNGYNAFDYDASDLGEGMYIYSISNELGAVSKKMIIGK
ncbi:MAG: T9SS type A sorting domain-containing protein [Bacteroidota bacterium]